MALPLLMVSCNGSGDSTGKNSSDDASLSGNTSVQHNADIKQENRAISSNSSVASEQGRPYVVDFYATWCPPCKKLAPVFHDLESKYADKADFVSIDIDKEGALATSMNIEGVPTVIVFADETMKQELGRVVGFDPEGIEALIQRYAK